jgi:hypothetical protein
MVKSRKRRVPPGGVWVLLAGEYRTGMWSAVVYTLLGEEVAGAIHVRRERAERAALADAERRARPVRVLREHELGDEHEDLRERFAEHLDAYRRFDAEDLDPELEYIEAYAEFLVVASEHRAPIVVVHDADVISLGFAPAAEMPPSQVESLRATGWEPDVVPLVDVTGRDGSRPVDVVHLRVLTAALLRRAA